MKAIIAGLVVSAVGCATDAVPPAPQVAATPAGPAYLEIQFTDRSEALVGPSAPLTTQTPPPPAPHLWVSVSRLEIEHAEGRWTTISAQPQRFDLLAVEGGNAAVLASAELPAGSYRTLAVEISAVTLDAAGTEQSLPIEHGSILLPIATELADTMPYALVLDLDGSKSLASLQAAGVMSPALSVASFEPM